MFEELMDEAVLRMHGRYGNVLLQIWGESVPLL